MKILLTMTTIAFILILIPTLIYISKIPGTVLEMSILRDITDYHIAQPDDKDIISYYNLSDDNKWNGYIFRFSNITDVSYTKPKVFSISPANKFLSNEISRDIEIHHFKDFLTKTISEAKNDSIGREYSSVYFPLANELNRLRTSIAEKKILIVYSDLMQNALGISLYHSDQLQQIQSEPEVVKEKLQKQLALNSLVGIEIELIYQPANPEEDANWQIISAFYAQLFKEKGATVYIGASPKQ